MASVDELLARMTADQRRMWTLGRADRRTPIEHVLSLADRIAHDVMAQAVATDTHDLVALATANAFCAGAIFASTQPIASDVLIAFLKADGAPLDEHATNGLLLAAHLLADQAQVPRSH